MTDLYINEDNHHFYGHHPPEDMSVEGIRRLVDFYAEGTQVAGILFCVNVQRALFDGDNVIELMLPQVDGQLVWAEILILPEKRQ